MHPGPFYHVAPVAARTSILAHGLDPAYALDGDDRTADPDNRPADAESHLDGPRAPGVWVYTDLDDAREWAAYMGDQEIWIVTGPLAVVDDPFASTANGYYSKRPIAASALVLLADSPNRDRMSA